MRTQMLVLTMVGIATAGYAQPVQKEPIRAGIEREAAGVLQSPQIDDWSRARLPNGTEIILTRGDGRAIRGRIVRWSTDEIAVTSDRGALATAKREEVARIGAVHRSGGVGGAVAVGIMGGVFGAEIGGSLQPDCMCDDPGLIGGMIGLPIGALV